MFSKQTGMRCTNPKCPDNNKVVEKRLTVCPKCNLRNEAVTRTNPPAIIAICALGLMLAVGGGYYGWSKISGGGSTGGAGTPFALTSTLSYAIQVDDGGFHNVKQNHPFRGGDRLRLITKTSFPAYLYCFHEDSVSGDIDIVAVSQRAIEPGQEATIPSSSAIRMDTQPAPEKFILIASARPVPEFDFGSAKVSRSDFRAVSDRVFANVKEPSSAADGDWMKVVGGPKDNSLLRTSFTLKHE